MKRSMLLLEAESEISDEDLQKLHESFDNKEEPTQITKFLQSISEGAKLFDVFRVAKKVEKVKQVYKIDENNVIIPTEEVVLEWETFFLYIRKNSKYIYVSGSNAGWVASTLSEMLYNDITKIKTREIDTSKIEEDIRQSSRFRSSGTSFIDRDGTKITIRNSGGVDLNTHYVTVGKENVTKNHIDLLIEKDDLTFEVYVYPEGKVTFYAGLKSPETVLRIFLKIWSEIKDYC
ncbi:MAG: hypothetical protein KKD75_04550 [Nanoarchaeota archaeon]|nr:hypothetical protein [Nanoarchaeota archaeon]